MTQKLDYTAQLLSTQKVITVPTLEVDVVSSFLTNTPCQSLLTLIDWLTALSMMH